MNSTADLALYQHFISGLWAFYAFVIGASIGSFLNVVAWRVPMGESIVSPGSHCPRCDHPLAWYDNIPVVGYLLLGGRCRYCKSRISPQYPLVEALGGFLGLGLWLTEGPGLGVFVDGVIVALLLALALIDARHFLLPLKMTLALGAIALLRAPLVAHFDLHYGLTQALRAGLPGLYAALTGAALLGAVAWLGTYFARRSGRIGPDEDAMGGGDVILIAAIGARLGVYPVLAVIFLASVQGALIGGILLWIQSLTRQNDEVSADGNEIAAQASGGAPQVEQQGDDTRDLAHQDGVRHEIGDDRAEDALEEDWTPPAYAIPFGPFLALAAVQWILFGDFLQQILRAAMDKLMPY